MLFGEARTGACCALSACARSSEVGESLVLSVSRFISIAETFCSIACCVRLRKGSGFLVKSFASAWCRELLVCPFTCETCPCCLTWVMVRDRCLARRSLTAAGVRPAGGIQQRFGDVDRWCHKLSSESKVREVPSTSAVQSGLTGFFCRNVYTAVACPGVVNYSCGLGCERTDKWANFCRPVH